MVLSSHYRGHHLLIEEYNPSERKPSHVRLVCLTLLAIGTDHYSRGGGGYKMGKF